MSTILIATLGTGGDVYPLLGLGVELKRRGHSVCMVTHARFENPTRRVGLDFDAIDTPDELDRLLANPDFWKSSKNFELLLREHIIPNISVVHDHLVELGRGKEVAIVANTTAIGARIAAESLGVPMATVYFAPFGLRSCRETPRYNRIDFMPRWGGPVLRAQIYRFFDKLFNKALAPPINEFRLTVGLSPIESVYDWWHAPELIVGLWPEWYGAKQSDWPPQTETSGFPNFDVPSDRDVQQTMDWVDQNRPIAFTSGTGMLHGQRFFSAATEACHRLKTHGILVTTSTEQLPQELGKLVKHAPYIPFGDAFPKCAAVVHHGGVGTASQGLAAGIPQVLTPITFDQFDNARRLQKLGVAKELSAGHLTGKSMAKALGSLLESKEVREKCGEYRRRLHDENVIGKICDLIENRAFATVGGYAV